MNCFFRLLNHLKFRKRQLVRFYQEKFVIQNYLKKREIIREYKKHFDLKLFVETGTFLGDTIDVLLSDFQTLYSIELQDNLARKAVNRFKGIEKVKILHGDSADILPIIMPELTKPTLFWLDGHYSSSFYVGNEFIETAKGEKETPIMEELSSILKDGLKGNVILIDDVCIFNGLGDYPTIQRLVKLLLDKGISRRQISIKKDIIRIVPLL
jgi:hypothetical protein